LKTTGVELASIRLSES